MNKISGFETIFVLSNGVSFIICKWLEIIIFPKICKMKIFLKSIFHMEDGEIIRWSKYKSCSDR